MNAKEYLEKLSKDSWRSFSRFDDNVAKLGRFAIENIEQLTPETTLILTSLHCDVFHAADVLNRVNAEAQLLLATMFSEEVKEVEE